MTHTHVNIVIIIYDKCYRCIYIVNGLAGTVDGTLSVGGKLLEIKKVLVHAATQAKVLLIFWPFRKVVFTTERAL